MGHRQLMEWEQKTAHYVESDKSYRITKGAEGAAGRYAAWPPGSKPETPALDYVDRLEKAKQICEDHLNNRSKP